MIGLRGVLNDNNISPYVKRLVLKERAGIQLSEGETKRLKNEVVSMVSPTAHHDRMKPVVSTLKSVDSSEEDEEFDLQELIDELEDEINLEDILKEMGFDGEEDESIDEVNYNSKGYKEARKLIQKLRGKLFRELNDDDLETFVDTLGDAFGLKRI